MKWQDKLKKAEKAHVKDLCGGTLRRFKEIRSVQLEYEKQHPGYHSCWDCHKIARKLSME